MGKKSGFDEVKEERKDLSFFKIFQNADLSSESIRGIPYNFMRKISEEDFSTKMVIRAEWGSSWELEISKNPRFFYMERHGWNRFVSDNALGQNEFVTFTHKGKMRFNVNFFHHHGKEILQPRKPPTSGVKKEPGESVEVVVPEVRRKKAEKSKASKKMVTCVESSGVRKRKAEGSRSSKKKEMIQISEISSNFPEFKIKIKKSHNTGLGIPKDFEEYLPEESGLFKIHHPDGEQTWEVLYLVREIRSIFSKGWAKVAREYPMLIGDEFTFKLIKPTEFLVVPSNKALVEITPIMID